MTGLKRRFAMSAVVLAAFVLLGTNAVCAGDDASTDYQKAPDKVTLSPRPWKEISPWQSVPDRAGEILLAPGHYQYGQFEHENRRFVATMLGVLESMPGGHWRIVPEMYGRWIIPITVRDGLLWARPYWEKQLVALDIGTWATRKRIPIPQFGTRVVAFEEDGFWLLEDEKIPVPLNGRSRAGPSPAGHASIVHYDMDGTEMFRYRTSPGKPAADMPQGYTDASTPLIYWAAVDRDAVWLAVQRTRIVRIDRRSGERRSVDANTFPQTLFVNLPKRILWFRREGRTKSTTVYQLQKEQLTITVAGKIDVPIRGFASDGTNLWVESDKTYVFSLKNLEPVAIEEAGPRPPALPENVEFPPLSILSVGDDRVWLWASQSQIAEIADDGKTGVWDVSQWVKSSGQDLRVVAKAKFLYAFVRGNLIRLESGSSDVLVRRLGDPSQLYPLHLSLDADHVWVQSQTGNDVSIFAPDLTSVATFSCEPLIQQYFLTGVALRGSCYVFLPPHSTPSYSARLVKIDSKTGKVTTVESWRKHFDHWCKKDVDEEPTGVNVPRFYGLQRAVQTPDGRLFFIVLWGMWDPASSRYSSVRQAAWYYDPAADHWEAAPLSRSIHLTSSPNLLIDKQDQCFLRYKDGKWQPVGRLSSDWLEAGLLNWPISATKQYFYARTPLGLYRVAWTDIPLKATASDSSTKPLTKKGKPANQ